MYQALPGDTFEPQSVDLTTFIIQDTGRQGLDLSTFIVQDTAQGLDLSTFIDSLYSSVLTQSQTLDVSSLVTPIYLSHPEWII